MRKLFVETLLARLLLALVLVSGLMAYTGMVRENYPDLDIPSAVVTTVWPGAAPEQIEKQVTKYLEDEINGLRGLDSYSSGSYNSYSVISVEFDADMSKVEAMGLLRAAVDKAQAKFPSDAGIEKPDIEEMSMSNMPVISFSLSGPVDDLLLSDTASRLQDEMEGLPLVKSADISGLREKSLHVELNPSRMHELGLSPLLVLNRLQAANTDMAWGEFEADKNTFNLYMAGRFESLQQVEQLPLLRRGDDHTVRLGDIANVSLRLDRETSRTFFSMDGSDYQPGVTLDIKKLPGADSFAVIDQTLALAQQFQQQNWPAGLTLTHISDDGEIIEQSFNYISSSMQQAVVIVFLVLMLLLTWREALVAGLALPVSILGVLAVMAVVGYSFNSMIMIGLVLALGLMVDVFILVMEGMHENLYVRKQSFGEAAVSTVKQFLLPAVAGQLTTILAMVPMMMVGGIDGKFIRILPITIVVTLLLSLLVAFLICIPLSRYVLESGARQTPHTLPIDRLTDTMKTGLANWLRRYVVASRWYSVAWVGLAFSLFVAAVLLAGLLPSLMYLESDDRKIGVSIELPPDATLEQSQQVADKAGAFLRQQDWIEKVVVYVGAKSPMTMAGIRDALLPSESSNLVGFSLTLQPKEQREMLSFDYLPLIRDGLDKALANEAGLTYKLVHIGGNPDTSAPVQIDLIGADYATLIGQAAELKRGLQAVPGATDVADNLGPVLHELRFHARPEMLSFHGLDEAELARQIRVAMSDDEVGYYKVAGIADDLKIRLSVDWPSRQGNLGGPRHLSELGMLQVAGKSGETVSLWQLADFEVVDVPRVYVHRNGLRAVTVMAQTDGRTATEIVNDITPVLQQMQQQWPAGYHYRLGGEVAKSGKSYGDMGAAFVIAMLGVYVLLTLMFNSFLQPAIILLVVPLAMTGTFLGYFLSATPMTFSGMIGIVSLAGIAVNNGIVLIDTMNQHLKAGESLHDAAVLGASDRLRPIISTSLTTVLSLVPLAISDPTWFPLCMAIIYGLGASTVTAIVVVPALFYLLTPRKRAEQTLVS
nr:efflux RND transporter permease subunit [Oceanobacter mangrovi]